MKNVTNIMNIPDDQKDVKFEKELWTIEKMVDSCELQVADSIQGLDIHPNLLQGLIPVNGPVFIGVDGECSRCKLIKFEWNEENFLDPMLVYNFPLIHRAVEELKKNNCKYILSIHKPLTPEDQYCVRGA